MFVFEVAWPTHCKTLDPKTCVDSLTKSSFNPCFCGKSKENMTDNQYCLESLKNFFGLTVFILETRIFLGLYVWLFLRLPERSLYKFCMSMITEHNVDSLQRHFMSNSNIVVWLKFLHHISITFIDLGCHEENQNKLLQYSSHIQDRREKFYTGWDKNTIVLYNILRFFLSVVREFFF